MVPGWPLSLRSHTTSSVPQHVAVHIDITSRPFTCHQLQRRTPSNQQTKSAAVQALASCQDSRTRADSITTSSCLASAQSCTSAASGASSLIARSAAGAAAVVTCTQGTQQAGRAQFEPLKMVLCVNQSLKMGKGKIGAQCAHAAIGVVLQLLAADVSLYQRWEQCGQRKIVVKVQDAQCMEALADAAAAAGYPAYIMRDAGRTQVAPGSQTVLALGPAPECDIDRLTGHLQLL